MFVSLFIYGAEYPSMVNKVSWYIMTEFSRRRGDMDFKIDAKKTQ